MTKSIITLRKKAISGGRLFLYLDYYPPFWDSKTNSFLRREFLKLYLHQKPADQHQKMANAENMHTAELIRAKSRMKSIR